MRGLQASFIREITSWLDHKWSITAMVLIPIVVIAMLSTIFYKGVPSDLPIAVFDQNQSDLSSQVIRMIDANSLVECSYKVESMQQGQELIESGAVVALLVIPPQFEANVYGNHSQEVPLFVSEVNLLSGALVEKGVKTVLMTFSVGSGLKKLANLGVTGDRAMAMAMPVAIDSHILFNPYTSYAYYLLPAFLPLTISIFALLSVVFAIGMEFKRASTIEWYQTAGNNIVVALVGKIAPYTIIYSIMIILTQLLLVSGMGVPLNGSPLMLIATSILLVLSYQAVGVIFFSLIPKLSSTLSIGAGYSIVAFSISGLTFPLDAMDGHIAALAYIFPLTYYMEIIITDQLRGASFIYSIEPLLAMLLFVVVSMITLPRLRAITTNSKYWGE